MGWEHRKRVLVSARTYHDPTRGWKPFPLSTNMHNTMVAGAGLCLYYNTLVFCCLAAFTSFVVTAFFRSPPEWMSPKDHESCMLRSAESVQRATADLRSYHDEIALGLGSLWSLLLLLSLAQAAINHRTFRKIDRETHLMSDYGIRASGFPPDAYEEEIEQYFNALSPGALVGVSLAYDYHEHEELVHDMLDEHLQQADLKWWLGSHSEEFEALRQQQKEKVEARNADVLRSLTGSGTAFVVFKTERLRVEFPKVAASHNRFRGQHVIEMVDVHGEPQNFFWEHFRCSHTERICNGIRELLLISVECFALAFVVYAPASAYVLAVHSSSDIVISLLGLVISGVNGILFVLVDAASLRVGFTSKGSVELCNTIGASIIVMVNTVYNLFVTVSTVSEQHEMMQIPNSSERAVRDAAYRHEAADILWYALFPSVLLLPFLLKPIYKTWLSLSAKIKYWVSIPYGARDLRSNQKITLRAAERGLEPEPMMIELDYANNITVASSAFLLMFFEPPYMSWASLVVCAWGIWTYCAQKYCHLRLNKFVEYTSVTLHDGVLYLWGFPLSLIAAAAAYWSERAGVSGNGSAITIFFMALGLYWLALTIVFNLFSCESERGTQEYSSMRRVLRYDYFNTNPIHVLKSQYLKHGTPLVFFQRGKEYLQKVHRHGATGRKGGSEIDKVALRGGSDSTSSESDEESTATHSERK
jgi:hypothetical protein